MKQEPILFPFPCTKSVLHGLVEYYEISKDIVVGISTVPFD